ncbi:MAG: hypothetical protein LQ338_001106 [Usnochroma carphineum]|nr:MAG: hypothetical protein LQ338_001106 [Usnochroma carphineum]
MPSIPFSTGLTITNPLILYRSLLALKKIDPDLAQHRLALHLQKLYYRLKDYEPTTDYRYQLDRIANAVGQSRFVTRPDLERENPAEDGGRRGIFSPFRKQKEKTDALALTRRLTNHESAVQLQSPQGLLLYGEVGAGKSMLVDLLADCLPNRKKRRWHFNTFMLEIFAKLEQFRRSRVAMAAGQDEEHSLLWLARDMISTSPILFLDEFQLPDRAASKILSNLLTSFFHLGGVLIATSNRMPEELANASGVEFAKPPASRLGMLRNRWGLLGSGSHGGKSESMFAGKGDFAAFLEVLRARCEVWNMEGDKDWRRREVDEARFYPSVDEAESGKEPGFHGLGPMAPGNRGLDYEQSVHMAPQGATMVIKGSGSLPSYYFVKPVDITAANSKDGALGWDSAVLQAVSVNHGELSSATDMPWQNRVLRVYGRSLSVPHQLNGVTYWTFEELCASRYGPADYITLASNFHTFILTDVPVLTLLHKNEARRLITLLDALYEARCKLLIRGAAGPDDIFFPETQQPPSTAQRNGTDSADFVNGNYPETFSEIFQDQTAPFRPNVSAYTSSASPPAYNSSPIPSRSSDSMKSARSILADEDSDFGPTYGAPHSSGSRYRGPADGIPGAGNEIGQQSSPDFARTAIFTGEDEKFAYKRAQSRLWEMCGARWWAREGDWWQPLGEDVRRWESSGTPGDEIKDVAMRISAATEGKMEGGAEETYFRHGASPFRRSHDPPPKISWTHAWGMMKWGKRAGAWGQGPEGLGKRRGQKADVKDKSKIR